MTSVVSLRGPAPLTPRLEPWMRELLDDSDACRDLLAEHGSPVNVIDTRSLPRNVGELADVAEEFGVDLLVQVARKANKALAVVDEARDCGFGIDVGSETELAQVLARGVEPTRVIVTAAVKTRSMLELCLESGALVALDNVDEAVLFANLAAARGITPDVALRLQPPAGGPWPSSRFGESAAAWERWLASGPGVNVIGLHFHLHGYDAAQRAAMLRVAFKAMDGPSLSQHPVRFVDIGGGIPMSYLDDGDEWDAFWQAHREALDRPNPLTWQANPLTNVYPYHQKVVRGEWLRRVLSDGGDGGASIAEELTRRGLQLRCEPGRSVLDGVGMTLARVAFRKRTSDGTFVVGLEMNRTQCRSTSDDFLVDPVLVRVGSKGAPEGESTEAPGASSVPGGWGGADSEAGEDGCVDAFLVGAYCIENELLMTRRLRVPTSIAVGDIVAFINTGGYLMHILESASHQIPLARNVSRREDGPFKLDGIDAR